MKSFPIISTHKLVDKFDNILSIYCGDKIKLLEAAQRATAGEPNSFIVSPNDIDSQIDLLRSRMHRTADNYGQCLLIKLIEELYDNLLSTGAIGVSDQDFIGSTIINLEDNSHIKYLTSKIWIWDWNIEVEGSSRQISQSIRGKNNASTVIVKDYILQYVQQAINAYRYRRPAAALSLMSIALEGTLRDALKVKGYTYTFGTPSQDIYDLSDMQIIGLSDGYKVIFPSSMPKDHNDFLNTSTSPSHLNVKIKRIKKYGDNYLEIRNVDDLIDFWSSNNIIQAGQIQIGGLGKAIDISRNTANILSVNDLPPDLDKVIQAVRNNLIHLSGSAMDEVVMKNHENIDITLGDFLENKNRVFDAVCTIGGTINTLYNRIATGTL